MAPGKRNVRTAFPEGQAGIQVFVDPVLSMRDV